MQIAPETMHRIAALFKGFDDPTRVQILSSLIGREMCVNEIAEAAGRVRRGIRQALLPQRDAA